MICEERDALPFHKLFEYWRVSLLTKTQLWVSRRMEPRLSIEPVIPTRFYKASPNQGKQYQVKSFVAIAKAGCRLLQRQFESRH